MSDLDNQEPPAPRRDEHARNASDVIDACESPRVARALTTHFLGGYYAALVPTALRKREGWEQRVSDGKEDVVAKLRRLSAQMDKRNHPDVASRIREICDLVAQPITEEIVEAIRAEDEELDRYIQSNDTSR